VVAARAARPGAWAAELLAMARAPAWSRSVPPVPVGGWLPMSCVAYLPLGLLDLFWNGVWTLFEFSMI